MKEGKILENAVNLSDLKLSEIVEKSGISKSQMYNLYKMDEIDEDYKAKLKRAGIDPDWSAKSTDESATGRSGPSPELMERIVALLEKSLSIIIDDSAAFKRDSDLLREMIRDGYKDGIFKISRVEKKEQIG